MTRFGYSQALAEATKDKLDQDLRGLEFRLDQIAKAVPQAGATVSRLDEVKETARSVVADLHEEIDKRTEVGV
jgi:uncharacterized protein YoxC